MSSSLFPSSPLLTCINPFLAERAVAAAGIEPTGAGADGATAAVGCVPVAGGSASTVVGAAAGTASTESAAGGLVAAAGTNPDVMIVGDAMAQDASQQATNTILPSTGMVILVCLFVFQCCLFISFHMNCLLITPFT